MSEFVSETITMVALIILLAIPSTLITVTTFAVKTGYQALRKHI